MTVLAGQFAERQGKAGDPDHEAPSKAWVISMTVTHAGAMRPRAAPVAVTSMSLGANQWARVCLSENHRIEISLKVVF